MLSTAEGRLRFLFLGMVERAWVGGWGADWVSCSKVMDSNLPAPRRVVKMDRKWAGVESIGTLTMKRLRESVSEGILGA